MGDAPSPLDQVMVCSEKTIDIDQVLDILGVIDRNIIFEISAAVIRRDVPGLLHILDDAYDRGYDLKRLYFEMVEHFRNLVVVQMGRNVRDLVDLPNHEIERMQEQLQGIPEADLTQIFDLFYREESAVRFTSQPKLTLEMAFLRMFQIQPSLTIDTLIEKLDSLRKQIDQMPGCEPRPVSGETDAGANRPSPVPDPERRKVVTDESQATQTSDSSRQKAAIGRVSPSAETDFESAWEKVQARLLESHPALAANLVKSRIKRVSAKRFEIEVNGNGFNMSMIQRKKNLLIIQNAFKKQLDTDIEISVAAGQSADSHRHTQKKDINRLKTEALSHPLVADAVEIFDGKVIDVKISESEEDNS
jgi:DNA polymerase-3 subunit gamma/tau